MVQAGQFLEIAVKHHQAGRLEAAEKAYLKLLDLDALNADGLRLLGGLYLQTRQLPKAVDYLERAAGVRPHDPETLTNLAISLRAIGRVTDAISHFEQALAIDRDYQPAMNNLASVYHDGGAINQALGLYGRVLELQPTSAEAHYNFANSLFVGGRIDDAITHYNRALEYKPDYLEAMINVGMALSHAGKGEQSKHWLSAAKDWFEKALKSDPLNVVALNNLGNVLRQLGRPEQAVERYRQALKVNPHYAQAAINLATSLRDLGRWQDAVESCQAALRAVPESSDARINLGCLFQERGRHEDAMRLFDEALERKPASIDARWNKAISLLSLGQYEEGWALHEVGLGVAHMRGSHQSKTRRWRGENLKGQRLLIRSEQGLGDSLQFVRYAEICKRQGAYVIVHCPEALRRLFEECPFIDQLPELVSDADFDMHIEMMSLPHLLRTSFDTVPQNIPYLHVPAECRTSWSKALGTKINLRVGIVWAGNPRENQLSAHLIDRRRSLSLDTLQPLLEMPDVTFYSLQKGEAAHQRTALKLQDRLIDLMEGVEDFADTAALVESLDLVISVDTSVVHLAGGLGKPVWILSRYDACWRWQQNSARTPWYPSAHIFGQTSPGEWSPVIAQVKERLIGLATSYKP